MSFGQMPDPNSLIRRDKIRITQTPNHYFQKKGSMQIESINLQTGEPFQYQYVPSKKVLNSTKKAIVKNFIHRQQVNHESHMQMDKNCHACKREELFAERFSKYKLRDYKDNTRMNINNANWSAQQEKRDRMVLYWQNSVLPNQFPPIDTKKSGNQRPCKVDKMTL